MKISKNKLIKQTILITIFRLIKIAINNSKNCLYINSIQKSTLQSRSVKDFIFFNDNITP